MFFKIIDNYTIEKAPRPLKIEGKDVFTTSEEIHNRQGFYRVITSEHPNDDKVYKPVYTLGKNAILGEWEEVALGGEDL